MEFLFAVALLAALAYFPLSARGQSALKSTVKTVPLAVFAGVAAMGGGPAVLVAGLALSAFGDLALSRDKGFLAGLIGFALAHLAYIALFWQAGAQLHLGAVLALGALAVSTEFWLAPHAGDMRWPVRVYVVLICAMGVLGLSLPQVRAGAVMFILSDLILAVQLFRLPEGALARVAGWALWALYVGGQAMILQGFVPLSLP